MNSLERARKFIAGKSAKLALTVVPLAAIAFSAIPSAKAGAITFSSGSCQVGSGSGACFAVQNANQGTDLNAPWVQVYSNGVITADSGNAVSLNGGGTASGSTTTGEVIPISWDFFVNSVGNSSGSVAYSLSLGLDGSGGGFAGTSDFASIGSEVTGSSAITIVSGGSVTDFNLSLVIFGNGFPQEQQPAGFSSLSESPTFSLTIPGGSTLDVNPGAATPEPASLLLAGAGGALLLLFKKKRRA